MSSQPSPPLVLDGSGDPGPPAFDRRRAWLVTAMIVTFMIVNFADKSVLGLAADPIMEELDISHSTYGLISSSYSILFSLSGLVVGFFAARISSRVLLFVMCLVWGVAQLPVLIVAAVPALVAGRVLLGAAEGLTTLMSMHASTSGFGGPPGPALGPPDRRCRPRHSRGGARGDLADHRVRLACRLRRAGRDEPGVERGVVVRRARRTL